MSVTTLRKQIHAYVDTIPEYRLEILKPLLSDYAEPDFLIETDLTDEEREIIAEGRKELKEHPENFEEAESFFASLGLSYADALEKVKRRWLNMPNEEYEDDILSEEEALLLEECRKDLKEHPENFRAWREIRKELFNA